MSLSCLPTELRLQIWQLAYFSQPPRLVELRTLPHDNAHDENTFCPRYSPSPPPIVVNTCREARKEALRQARKDGHIVRLHHGPRGIAPEQAESTAEFYFRFETDILYLPLEGRRVQHFDDSPENGLLPHFYKALGCDAMSLRNIAITSIIKSGYRDGSLSNTLRSFPNIQRIYMIVPDEVQKALFVRAARRIMTMYRFDRKLQTGKSAYVEANFARVVGSELQLVPLKTWVTWSDLGGDWGLRSYLECEIGSS
jgi:uncharacterized protein (DUF952 family)